MAHRTISQAVQASGRRAGCSAIPGQRKDYPLGGVPVEYQGGSITPPDQRRSYHS
jgi:hypothetical protein